MVSVLLWKRHPQKIIKTTIDSNLQELVESRIRFFINRKRHLGIANAAVLLADSETMEVLAAVGSARFYDDAIQGQVDGNIAKRSPGSALKPFIYALALDQGIIWVNLVGGQDEQVFNGASFALVSSYLSLTL